MDFSSLSLALGGQKVPPQGRSTHPTLSPCPGQGQAQDGLSGRGALLCPCRQPRSQGSVEVSAGLGAGLCAGLQPLLVALPPLAARARRGPGVAVPVEDSFAFTAPGGSVELEGEDDVAAVADLADEASLGAQVTAVHVVGCKLQQ